MRPLKVFIGFDQVESVAWHVMAHSILSRASIPVEIIPVKQSLFKGFYNRERDPRQSNEFSFTRFLVPYLSDYGGWSVFFDCDQMVTCDIAELLELADPEKAIQVVKHDYEPVTNEKYLGNRQYSYPRKNWSSVVLWNCYHHANEVVTPEFVNNSEASVLHQFKWLEDEHIGELPVTWNWLVGEYHFGYKGIQERDIKNWHWTVGGPYFEEYAHVDGSDAWFDERAMMNFCLQREELEDAAVNS